MDLAVLHCLNVSKVWIGKQLPAGVARFLKSEECMVDDVCGFFCQRMDCAKLISNGGDVFVLCGTANVRDGKTDVFAQISLSDDRIATRFDD